MSAMVMKVKQRTRQYEKTVIEFAAKENGCFFVVSHDLNFVRGLRNTLNKELVIGSDLIRATSETSKFLAEIKTPLYKDKQILLLIERVLDGRNTLAFIRQFKESFDRAYVIVLTSEVEKSVLVLLHEMGVDSFITKPASMDTIIEKIAFTIRPQSKLGQLIDTAKDYLSRGLNNEALALAGKILADVKPGSAAALMIQGDAHKAMGDFESAVAAYESAADGAYMYLEPLKKLADLYKETGDMDGQLAYLEKLDKLSPLNVERKVDMGSIHLAKGDGERAEVLFEQAVTGATKEAMGIIEEIKRSIAERSLDKNPELSERYFRSIIADKKGGLSREDIATFNRLGIALRRQGKWQDAVAEYGRALEISPDDENILFNMAVAYTEGGRHPDAVASLEKALELNPTFYAESPVACFNIGVMYLNARHAAKAKLFLRRALELDPEHQGAQKLIQGLG
ncbi:MAG: tetratricopeptide repeat protein [Thermodesulfobacteriota bacterium]